MIQDLIKQLNKVKFPTVAAIESLKKIQQKTIQIKLNQQNYQQSIIKLIQILVNLTCPNQSHMKNKNFELQTLFEKGIKHVEQILYQVAKNIPQISKKIAEQFMMHILKHPSCYRIYLLLYKLNKQLGNRLLSLMQYGNIKKLNIKIISHFHICASEISLLHSLSSKSSLALCQSTVSSFLSSHPFPHNSTNQQSQPHPTHTKIPPLLLPLSVGSSRYLGMRKGVIEMSRLAEELGEGFVAGELGGLLGNKRTRQVKQFTDEENYRQQVIDKVETDRATSRLDLFNSAKKSAYDQFQEEQSARHFKLSLIINANILFQKLSQQDEPIEPFLRQYLDLAFSQMIKTDSLRFSSDKIQFEQFGNQNKIVLHSLQKIFSQLMTKCSLKSQSSHIGRLLNRNKQNSCYHYSETRSTQTIKDQLLEDIQITKQTNFKASQGKFTKQDNKKLVYQDFVIQYILHYLKQLLATCNMSKSKFYLYQSRLLGLLSYYLSESGSNTTKYLTIQKVFPLLMLIKRQLLQQSHPYISSQNHEKCLVFKYSQLFGNYLLVVSNLITNNKHTQKLISNLFIKNLFFMDLLKHFAAFVFQQQIVQPALSVLEFYLTSLRIFYDRKNRNQQSKTLKIIFMSIGAIMNSTNGCIAKTIGKLEKLIKPNNHIDGQINGNIELHYFFQRILKFIWQIYYYCDSDQISMILLQQQTSSFYLKFSMINFIKLYSSLTVTQLYNAHFNSKQALTTTKQSPHHIGSNINQDYMINLLKILSSISINRTQEISKKIRQYRILEFFVRELQLEFSVTDNVDKYIKKAKKNKEVPSKFHTEANDNHQPIQKGKNIKIPSLNLTGDTLKKNTPNSKNQQPQQVKSKKMGIKVPMLKIPLKSQQKQQRQSSQGSFHLQLTKLNLGTNQSQRQGSCAKTSERHIIYWQQRKIRKIYSSKTLHSQCLLLVLSLLLYKGLLDPFYCDQFPITHGKTNILYILHFHLNHQHNKSIIPIIGQLVGKIKPYLAGQRLLKLLTNMFTDITGYKNWKKINSGAYGVIYSCETNINQPKEVAIKEMNFPKSIYERCVLHDIFTEITCLQNFRLDDRITKMYNYGVVQNTYVIVLKRYQCSLRQWILQRKSQLPKHLPTLLTIYFDILKIIKTLHQQRVTHYDIKADNILLDIDKNDQSNIKVVFGDFGECKIYNSDKDQLDMKSRGTQCIKSPEMLTLALQSKKEADHYDRRKKIGTTRASDIWSLGCLFYEVVTGEFLFHRADWVNFYVHVTSNTQQLLTPESMQKLCHNTSLIQFLRFMLIRDPHHRPSITNLLDKFSHLYGLLVPIPPTPSISKSPLLFNQTLDGLVQSYVEEIKKRKDQQQGEFRITSRKGKAGTLLKIMNDIYYCDSINYFRNNAKNIKIEGITHVISSEANPLFNNVFIIKQLKKNDFYTTMSLAFKLCPRISDILRQVLLVKGKLLFVNDQTNYAVNLLIYTLSYWFRCSVYQTWCLINCQILLFPALSNQLIKLSSTLQILNRIQSHIESLPKLQCICGTVTMILKKKLIEKKGQFRSCKCKDKQLYEQGRNGQDQCPSVGCGGYLEFLKRRYSIVWDTLKWVRTNQSFFLTTLFKRSNSEKNYTIKDCLRTQIILNSAEPHQNMFNSGSSVKDWKIYQCKVCEMWMLGMNDQGQIWVVMNNLIRRSRQGIMIPNAQQDFKMRTPALNLYTLSKLHMTSQ